MDVYEDTVCVCVGGDIKCVPSALHTGYFEALLSYPSRFSHSCQFSFSFFTFFFSGRGSDSGPPPLFVVGKNMG